MKGQCLASLGFSLQGQWEDMYLSSQLWNQLQETARGLDEEIAGKGISAGAVVIYAVNKKSLSMPGLTLVQNNRTWVENNLCVCIEGVNTYTQRWWEWTTMKK